MVLGYKINIGIFAAMGPETKFIENCLATLERAKSLLSGISPEHPDYNVFRIACIKEFELVLEISSKLVRKKLKEYTVFPESVDDMVFKDVFRNAVLRNILSDSEGTNWFRYRELYIESADDYRDEITDKILGILPQFISDSRTLISSLKKHGIK